jgi:hypothetical protein
MAGLVPAIHVFVEFSRREEVRRKALSLDAFAAG